LSDELAGLEPALLWGRFAELTRIPRPSKAEGPAREHVLAWAAGRSLQARSDAEGNVVVRIPADGGREATPVVVLQAHLDMVCERDASSPFDPREGRIDVHVEDDWVAADGTTLGADNGIGVAAAMAVADDTAIEHGPLELLFTVSEEHGLDGAKALDASLVTGRMLINLDGTSDDALTIGCAGSDHTFLRLPLPATPVPTGHAVLHIELTGARGGHSAATSPSGASTRSQRSGECCRPRTAGRRSVSAPSREASAETRYPATRMPSSPSPPPRPKPSALAPRRSSRRSCVSTAASTTR
jgi:dipeptidase D